MSVRPMPWICEVLHPSSGAVLWSAPFRDFPCASAGCEQRTEWDLTYCPLHLESLRRLAVRPSALVAAGLGLFATGAAGATTFRVGERLGAYDGERISEHELARRYDLYDPETGELECECVAPFALRLGEGVVIDGFLMGSAIVFANDHRGSPHGPNSEVDGSGIMTALRDIKAGDEILWDYGEDYWQPGARHARWRRRRV